MRLLKRLSAFVAHWLTPSITTGASEAVPSTDGQQVQREPFGEPADIEQIELLRFYLNNPGAHF